MVVARLDAGMIRITLVQDSPELMRVKEFDDIGMAASWLVEDSYFAESYTRTMIWERIDMATTPDEEARRAAALAEAERVRREALAAAEAEQRRQSEQGK